MRRLRKELQIINLLQNLKQQIGLTYLFISHDLSVVRYVSDRIGVMYLGNLVELASTKEIFEIPCHPYTKALLSAIPDVDAFTTKGQLLLDVDIPSPVNPPSGCSFMNDAPTKQNTVAVQCLIGWRRLQVIL